MAQMAHVTIVYDDGSKMTAEVSTVQERIYPIIFAVMEQAESYAIFDAEGKEYDPFKEN